MYILILTELYRTWIFRVREHRGVFVIQVLSGCAVLLVLVCADGSLRASPQTKAAFPPLLDTYFTAHVHLTPAERKSLLSNVPVTKLLEADPNKEVSVFGAVWIDAAPADYVRLLEDIERFERGGRFQYHQEDQRSATARRLRALPTPRRRSEGSESLPGWFL